MHILLTSVRGWDSGSAASVTCLGGIESIPAAILVFYLWARLLISFAFTLLKPFFFLRLQPILSCYVCFTWVILLRFNSMYVCALSLGPYPLVSINHV